MINKPPLSTELPIPLPAPGEGKRGEAGHLGYLLRQAAAAQRLRMERVLADLPITAPQFALLTMLDAYPGSSNAELARLTLLTPQTVSPMVTSLERSGLLARTPHLQHGRIQQLSLSPAGATLLAEAKARVARLEQELAAPLAEEELLLVKRWLANLASGMEGEA
ncbi:MarR family winged helix-turn-helix transcriptional regulator [Aeromonas hydrophila]|uniref:MarR family winged helix-turn-helix transcriptional regulator n=1 Tax=Aeromonas hydrophila TaxID=644 RepID=UPI003EC92330